MNGRNDDYSPDFKRRFQQSINFLAYSAQKAGVLNDIEVICTDWNSDVPLYDELRFSEDAAKILKFVIVPPQIAKKHNWKNTPFHTTKSINVAVRRAKGKFIGYMPGDILIPEFSIERIIRLLKGNVSTFFNPIETILAVPRKLIPENFSDGVFWGNDYENIEKTLCFFDCSLRTDAIHIGTGSNSGIVILDKYSISKNNGFHEKLGGWGFSDHEIALRQGRTHKIINTGGLGIFCYDFPPAKLHSIKKIERYNELNSIDLFVNSENWGLKEYNFGFVSAKAKNNDTCDTEEKLNEVNYFNKIIPQIAESNYKQRIIKFAFRYSFFNFTPIQAALFQLFPRSGPVKYLDLFSNNCKRFILSGCNQFADLYYYPPLNDDNTLDMKYFWQISSDRFHTGVCRCIPCIYSEIEASLLKVFVGNEITFDIINLCCDYLKKDSYKYYKENIHKFLSRNGLLLYYGTEANYKLFSDNLLEDNLDFTLIKCDKLHIGLMLKNDTKREIIDDEKTQELLYNVWSFFSRKKKNILFIALVELYLCLFTFLKKSIILIKRCIGSIK